MVFLKIIKVEARNLLDYAKSVVLMMHKIGRFADETLILQRILKQFILRMSTFRVDFLAFSNRELRIIRSEKR